MGSSQADKVQVELTNQDVAVLHEMLETHVQNFYDDLSDDPALIRKCHKQLISVAVALGFDFTGCVDRVCSRTEKQWMGRILAGANTRAEIEKVDGFDCPEALSQIGQKAYDIIEQWRIMKNRTHASGRVYYSPQEWIERGEQYGTKAALIIVHDGGDISSTDHPMSLDDSLVSMLGAGDFFIEACTNWYDAVYWDKPTKP